ncbi:MAG: hypothetical protein ACREMB_26975 [Candidatus Rokuibacteriota bacterium]
MERIMRYLKDQRGIETLEWILIGGLVTAAGLIIYPGTLVPGLTGALTAIVAAITAGV